MPQPKSTLVSGPLQNASIAYRNPSYAADRVFPIIEKVAASAKLARYLKGAWFRDEADVRGPGARAKRGGYPTDYIDVSHREYAFAHEVTDEDREEAKSQSAAPLQPDTDAVEFCADKIDLKKEVVVSALVAATNWSAVGAGGEDADGKWVASTGNTFFADIRTGQKTIRANTGMEPNVLLLDYATYNGLKEVSEVLDKIKYTERGVLTAHILAALLDLEEVIVAGTVKSSAKESKAGTDFTAANIWEVNAGKGMGFLFYRPKRMGLKTPSAGVQCRGSFLNGAARRVTTWREEDAHMDVYEVAEKIGVYVTGTDLGYMWKDTYAT